MDGPVYVRTCKVPVRVCICERIYLINDMFAKYIWMIYYCLLSILEAIKGMKGRKRMILELTGHASAPRILLRPWETAWFLSAGDQNHTKKIAQRPAWKVKVMKSSFKRKQSGFKELRIKNIAVIQLAGCRLPGPKLVPGAQRQAWGIPEKNKRIGQLRTFEKNDVPPALGQRPAAMMTSKMATTRGTRRLMTCFKRSRSCSNEMYEKVWHW